MEYWENYEIAIAQEMEILSAPGALAVTADRLAVFFFEEKPLGVWSNVKIPKHVEADLKYTSPPVDFWSNNIQWYYFFNVIRV